MAQVFHPNTNSLARVGLAGILVAIVALPFILYGINKSPAMTRVGLPVVQPVMFSHKHHATDDGIDCRYCHRSVEVAAFAGMPSTHVCMTCHSQIWKHSPMLAPVRESAASGQPLMWNRVNQLPDFVFFNHSIHVSKGVGCTSCHGEVDQMQLTSKGEPLNMQFCLECHREPERYLRPRSEVFNMSYQPPKNQVELGQRLMHEYDVHPEHMTNCTTCHR